MAEKGPPLAGRVADFLAEAAAPLPVLEILKGLGLPGGAPRRAEVNQALYQDRATFAHLAWTSPPHWYVLGRGAPGEEMAEACALVARQRKGRGKGGGAPPPPAAASLTVGAAVERFEAGVDGGRR
jgi:hypothetical protein